MEKKYGPELRSALKKAPAKMSVRDEKAWEEIVRESTEGNDLYCVVFADCWARLMEARIAKGGTIEKCAKRTEKLADWDHCLTGGMYTHVIHILSQAWVHGKSLRRWHNAQFGADGKRANKKGAIVNPSVVNITA